MEIFMNFVKRFWLGIARLARKFACKIPLFASYFLLIFSVAVCVVLLVPEWFDQVPVLSYYISEQELPMAYELRGEVIIYDQEGEQIDTNAQVFVGGYHVQTETGTNFTLTFSSPAVNSIYAVIRYEIDGQVFEHTQVFLNDGHTHVFEGKIIIHV